MSLDPAPERRPRQIILFLALTFSASWSFWIILVGLLGPTQGHLLLMGTLGAWAPTVVALVLTRLGEGKDGLRALLGRIVKWRVGLAWYLVVLFATATIALAAIGIDMLLGARAPTLTLASGLQVSATLREQPWLLVLVLLVYFIGSILVAAPTGEEIGWRGYLFPKLHEGMRALDASLIVGVLWVAWHVPLFLLPGAQVLVAGLPFLPWALMIMAMSVLMAWVYVNTGSALMPVLYHAAFNLTLGGFGLLGPGTGDIRLIYLNAALMWVCVGIVILIFGRDLARGPQRRALQRRVVAQEIS